MQIRGSRHLFSAALESAEFLNSAILYSSGLECQRGESLPFCCIRSEVLEPVSLSGSFQPHG